MRVPPCPIRPRWGEQRGPSCVPGGAALCWGCFHGEGVVEAKRGSNTTHPSSSPPHTPPPRAKSQEFGSAAECSHGVYGQPASRTPSTAPQQWVQLRGGLQGAEPSPKHHTKGQQGQTPLLGHQIHPARNLSPAPATGTVPPGGVRSLRRRSQPGESRVRAGSGCTAR